MSIQVSHVTKIFGQQKALDDIAFSIQPGEVVGLLGPNGAGKSTLMKIITCFIPPTSGEVNICGFDIFEDSLKVREKIGYLPEHNPLYLEMYVKEYLEFIAGIHHISKGKWQRINEMIELTGLKQEQNKQIGALSKGYRQRVGLAQALIHDPEVIILDEPTSGLDPNQIQEIRYLIREVGKEKTVMLSTHIMQEVEAICDRSIIIHKGKIVADAATHDLIHEVGNKDIVTVEFSKPVDNSFFKAISGILGIKKEAENSWILETARGHDIREDLFREAVNNQVTILAMSKEELRLEEVFQMLTQS